MKKYLFCVVWLVMLAGCSRLQCWYGDCKDVGDVSEHAALMAADQSTTNAELVAELATVADYYDKLLANSKPFGGMYANADYHALLVRGAASSAEVAYRAENGLIDTQQMIIFLRKFATNLDQLHNGMMGQK